MCLPTKCWKLRYKSSKCFIQFNIFLFHPYLSRMSLVCNRMLSCVTRMSCVYDSLHSFAIRMSSAYHSCMLVLVLYLGRCFVFVCHLYVTRMMFYHELLNFYFNDLQINRFLHQLWEISLCCELFGKRPGKFPFMATINWIVLDVQWSVNIFLLWILQYSKEKSLY